ncbi:MAG TPA: nitroreductase family protein [bacterium]|nr:nitroreductase family protein [bacterium]
MEILRLLAERRAYRYLSSEPLPSGAARRIVEAGTLSPSCFNNQPWRIVAAGKQDGSDDTDGDAALEALKATLSDGNAWAKAAPLIIAIAVRASDDCRMDDGRDYALFDAGLCAMGMIVQASSEGLVAHPIAGYNPKKAKSALGIPSDYVLATLIIVARRKAGDAEDDPVLSTSQKASEKGPRSRKPLVDVASFGRWDLPGPGV